MVVLDDEQIIAAAIDDLSAQLALAKHGIAGDQPAFQDDGFQNVHSLLGFVGGRRNCLLTENASGRLIQQGQEVNIAFVCRRRIAQRLAVHRDGLHGLGPRELNDGSHPLP